MLNGDFKPWYYHILLIWYCNDQHVTGNIPVTIPERVKQMFLWCMRVWFIGEHGSGAGLDDGLKGLFQI